MTKRAWLWEPLTTALLVLTVFLASMVAYAINSTLNGVALPYSSGFDFVIRLGLSALNAAVVLAPWIGLAILGNYLLRCRGGLGLRLLITFVIAELLCLPIAIWAGISLVQNPGWDKAALIGLAIPVVAPALIVLAHLLVAACYAKRDQAHPGVPSLVRSV
ncbi:MAG TPA: hypothetical protein VGO31_12990 [Microbacteriaceae bacterium]|jgi:hypothetical protein|nr:hypothetical protein [Microbacteriaceae bacterium]